MKTIKTAICTETTFIFNHITKTIDGKANDFKRAGIPGSEHEALLLRRMAAQPTYTLNPISPKKNPAKETYAGLNIQLMREFIPTQENAEERMAEFEEFVEKNSSYPTIKSWFIETYKGFTVEKAKKAITAHEIKSVKKAVVIKLNAKKTVDFAKASNQ